MADDLTEGLTPGGEPPSRPPPTTGAEPPPEDSTPTFVRNTIVMSTGTAISRLTGFLRLSAMAYAIGITETRLADAYNVANITPNILYELALGGILTSVVVPVVVEWMQSRGRDAAWDVVRRLFTIAIMVLSAIAILGILLAPWIVDLYTVGYPDAQREAVHGLATFFLRWFMPQVVFYGIGAVAAGLLNAHRRFAAPMFAPIANNVIVIATFLIFVAIDPDTSNPKELATGAQQLVLAIGTTLGVVAMTVALWPSVRATGFRFRWIRGVRDEAIARIGRLATWVVVYVVANQLGYLVIVILAGGPTGGYSSYAAAFILFQLPHAIFAVSILTALLPAMSSRWAAEDLDGYKALLSQGIRATATILIPAALGYLVLAKPIVRLLLEHGATTAVSAELVSEVLFAFAIGLFAFSAFQFLLRASYAMQDTRTPALVNVAAVAVNVLVDLLFFFVLHLGVPGLALGHAVSYAFASSVLLLLIRRRIGRIGGRKILASLGRILVAGLATAAVAWLVAEGFEQWLGTTTLATQTVQVLGAVVAGLAVFIASAAALRIEEVDLVRRQVAARWR
ncbi:MAG TPA: murein biosynthesis integral membrane protein MurJ [Actinomycetota bacterium]|nr:murein biosynthesis integral membrane protein MurJ [Actinomycetota bacterium]